MYLVACRCRHLLSEPTTPDQKEGLTHQFQIGLRAHHILITKSFPIIAYVINTFPNSGRELNQLLKECLLATEQALTRFTAHGSDNFKVYLTNYLYRYLETSIGNTGNSVSPPSLSLEDQIRINREIIRYLRTRGELPPIDWICGQTKLSQIAVESHLAQPQTRIFASN